MKLGSDSKEKVFIVNLDNKKLEFPCEYPIKVIGLAKSKFKKNVLNIIHDHFEHKVSDDLISFKMSKNNKYLSITVNFIAKSRGHVDAIYADLKQCSEVVCML